MAYRNYTIAWDGEESEEGLRDEFLDSVVEDYEDEGDFIRFEARDSFINECLENLAGLSEEHYAFELSRFEDWANEDRFVCCGGPILFRHSVWASLNGGFFGFTAVRADGEKEDHYVEKVSRCVIGGYRKATIWCEVSGMEDLLTAHDPSPHFAPSEALAPLFGAFGEVDDILDIEPGSEKLSELEDEYFFCSEDHHAGGFTALLAHLKNSYDSPEAMLKAVFTGGYTERLARKVTDAWEQADSVGEQPEGMVRGYGQEEDLLITAMDFLEGGEIDARFAEDDLDFVSNAWCASALKYVRRQTPEICLAAVKQDAMALEHVQEQTPEICLAAVEEDCDALEYVRDDDLRAELEEKFG